MNEIFRFVFLRAPRPPRAGGVIAIPGDLTSLGHQLAALRRGENARERMRDAVASFARTPEFFANPSALPLSREFGNFGTVLRQTRAMTIDRLKSAVQDSFGTPPARLMQTPEFRGLERHFVDGILVLKLRPELAPRGLAEYTRLSILWHLVERIASNDASLQEVDTAELLNVVLAFPADILPLPRLPEQPSSPATAVHEPATAALVAEIALIGDVTEEILAVRGADLTRPAAHPTGERPPLSFVLGELAIRRLSPRTRTVLDRLSIDPAEEAPQRITARLSAESTRLRAELRRIEAAMPRPRRRIRIGGTTLPAFGPAAAGDVQLPASPPVPTSVGLLNPSGVGDLLVERLQIKAYVAEELAHIENVLKTEKLARDTRRLERTEESFTVERESTREQERDLQSTDRFEMESEIKNTIKEEDKFKFGSGVSGGFGKFVQASIKIETESVDSQEEVNRTASKYARDTTEKTAATLTERVREQQTRTILREFEEKNSHGFDNTAGTEHVIGLYQWVNRVYEAQVYNYGIRMFFDIMVPEPAAFYLQVVSQQDHGDEPEKFTSSPDSITAENYGELVARYQATAVEPPPAETVIVSKTIKVEMEQHDGTRAALIEHGAIAIPPGYEATEVRYRFSWHRLHFPNITPEPVPQLVAQFGQHLLLKDPALGGSDPFQINDFVDNVAVDGETVELPYSMHFYAMSPIALVIEVVCTRSARGYADWKQRTYEAILQAYLRQEETYRNRLAELEAKQGVAIEGSNPLEFRVLERNELKRSAVSMLTGQHFVKFSAILESGVQKPQIDFDEALAEGAYARFFEQAFEWEFMEYEFLPYFWGRQSTWVDRLKVHSVDPIHAAFLQAGYARVRLPVRPDFERGVFHFLDTGEVWDGGELPPVTNRDYAGYLDEIAARRRRKPDEEIPVGEPFDIRLPTTLVRVKPTSSLPTWVRNDDGDWIPADE